MPAPNPESLKLVKDHSLKAIAFAVARVPNSGRVFLGSSDFKVSEADFAAAKFEPKDLFAHESYVTGVALAGTTLVSGGYDGKLTWFDTEKKAVVRTVDAHAKWVRKVVASADGKLVASVADDMVCKVWKADGSLVHTMKGHAEKTPTYYGSMLYTCAFSNDGALLATADKVGHVVVWDVKEGKEIASVEAPVMYTWDPNARRHSIGGVRAVAFSPDGTKLAVGGTGKIGNIDHLEAKARIELFDWKAKKNLAAWDSDKFAGIVNKLAWAPDGSWLLGAGGAGEGFLLFLDPAGKKAIRQEKLPMHVHDFALSEAADAVYAVGHNKASHFKLG